MKTSLETLRIIFAWFRGKTATRRDRSEENEHGKTARGRERERERTRKLNSPHRGSRLFQISTFIQRSLFIESERDRGQSVLLVYSFNVRRINYHKNARVMRINIVSWTRRSVYFDYLATRSRNLSRIPRVRTFLQALIADF